MENNNEIGEKLGKLAQWQEDHAKDDHQAHQEIYARFDIMESNISLLPTKNDIEKVVKDAMIETLFKTGKGTKMVLITVATVVGSLIVIGGGFKWILGLIGFTYLGK